MTELASIDQLRRALNIDSVVHDTDLRLYLAAASSVVMHEVPGVDVVNPPAAAQLATLIIAQQLWEAQQLRGGDDRPSFGAAGEGGPDMVPRGFAVPYRALTLLRSIDMRITAPQGEFPVMPVWPAR